ncbi:carbamate kinase-like protein [Escherichia coli]|uniref:Carbamate kinase-like protein n=1 Tax=Escherichia coli TaxID=562 RepID=A0A484VX42_ECOLX|nr:carbamate kinase-like protein [Escherichia coli]
MKELVVVAIGGNSIIKDNASQSIEHQAEAVKAVADTVLEMLASDYDIVLTHGNGPQVGLDLRRAEIAHEREGLPLTPLANCVADTQGGIGYLIQQALNNRLARHGEKKAVTVVTQVEVDKNDPGLPIPSNPLAHSLVKASVTNYKRQTLTGVLLKMPDGAIAAWSPRRNRNVLSKHLPLRR